MLICESSTTLRSLRKPISHGVEMDVCASPSNKLHDRIHESDCVRPKRKPCKRWPDAGTGKLVEGASNQRRATESGRVTEYAVP
jgi:hypothetical protein